MATQTKRDYYDVLGLSRGAGADEIKKAYRKLAMQHHPDRNPSDVEAENKFKEATEAYEVLSNDQKRTMYDQYGHAGMGGAGFDPFAGFGGADPFSSIFDAFFGQGARPGGGGRSGVRQGADLRVPRQKRDGEGAEAHHADADRQRLAPACPVGDVAPNPRSIAAHRRSAQATAST